MMLNKDDATTYRSKFHFRYHCQSIQIDAHPSLYINQRKQKIL